MAKYCPFCKETFSWYERLFGYDDKHINACSNADYQKRQEEKEAAEKAERDRIRSTFVERPSFNQDLEPIRKATPVPVPVPVPPVRTVVVDRPVERVVYVEEPALYLAPALACAMVDIVEDAIYHDTYVEEVYVEETYAPVYEEEYSYSNDSYSDSSSDYSSSSDDY